MDLGGIISEYNRLTAGLSKSMPAFSEYTMSEIDYCIIFDLNELGHEYITYELWDVVQRGIYSPIYTKKKSEPCPISGLEYNKKVSNSSYWSVSVKQYRDHCENKIVPVNNAGKHSTNIILFVVSLEIKESINSIMRELIKHNSKAEVQKNGNLLLMKHLLSEKRIKAVIREYYENTIMRGNYFTLALAVEAVQNSDFSQEKKTDMVTALKLINDNGEVHKARQYIAKNQMIFPGFNESLKNLVSAGINPITISDEHKIDHIPGLLETCESLVYDNIRPVAKP
jgi:hypothetical protein